MTADGTRRVLVVGSGGSGKSTFARRLAEQLGLPLIHLDAIYWRDGRVETPKEEWRAIVSRLITQPRWVMDGNYGGTLDIRLAAADTVIFLDLPRLVCLWRVLKRYVQLRVGAHRETAAGNPERLTWSFLWWIWTYPASRRPSLLARLNRLQGTRVVVLSSQAEVDAFHRTETSRVPASLS